MFGAEGPVCVKARGRSMPGIVEAPERRLQGWLRARGQVAPGRVWGQTLMRIGSLSQPIGM